MCSLSPAYKNKMGSKLHNWKWICAHGGTWVTDDYPTTRFYSDGNGNVIWHVNIHKPEIASSGWYDKKFRKVSDDVDFCVKNGKIVKVKNETPKPEESKMNREFSVDSTPVTVRSGDMEPGNFAIFREGPYEGRLLYKTYDGVYELLSGDVPDCWTNNPDYLVEILKRGTKITITV